MENPLEKQIQTLSDKVIAARKDVAGIEALENEVDSLETRVKDIKGEFADQNARDRATAALAVRRLAVMQVPDILQDIRQAGPLKLGFISMGVMGSWDEAVAVVADLEGYPELAIEGVELTPTALATDVTANITLTYPADISSGETQISTEEIILPPALPSNATPELKIAELGKILTALEKLRARQTALEKRRDELNRSIEAYEKWVSTKLKPSGFLRGLPARWPIGIPGLGRVLVHGGTITIYTNGEVSEVSPFLLEFLKEINKLAEPFVINLNPLIKNVLDGRSLDLSEKAGRIQFVWKELPVLDFPANSVLSIARGRDEIYIVIPSNPATSEEPLAGRKWAPKPARSIRAVVLENRETRWDLPLNPPLEITNVIIDPKGRVVYGAGKSLIFLSPENGKTVATVPLEADAMELAIGAWDRLIVRCRRNDGKEDWITVVLPN